LLVAAFLRWTGRPWVAVIAIGVLLLALVGAAYFVLMSSGIDLRALDRHED